MIISLAVLRADGPVDPGSAIRPAGRSDRSGIPRRGQLVKGQWRYHDVKIVDADSRAVGPDLKPSGAPIKTYDYAPHAGVADFDDSQWEAIDADDARPAAFYGQGLLQLVSHQRHDSGKSRRASAPQVRRSLLKS